MVKQAPLPSALHSEDSCLAGAHTNWQSVSIGTLATYGDVFDLASCRIPHFCMGDDESLVFADKTYHVTDAFQLFLRLIFREATIHLSPLLDCKAIQRLAFTWIEKLPTSRVCYDHLNRLAFTDIHKSGTPKVCLPPLTCSFPCEHRSALFYGCHCIIKAIHTSEFFMLRYYKYVWHNCPF